MMHASRYFVKGGNIQPKGDIFWLISQHDSLPCTFGEVPPRLAEKRKKLKFHCCVGFKNVPVFETTPTKSLYFPCLHMGLLPDGRLCIRIMQGRTHIFIVITSTMTPTSGICLTDQESFAKCMVLWVLAHFQNQAVSVNDLVS